MAGADVKCAALPGGGYICGTRTRRKCSSCGTYGADRQCDYPVKVSKVAGGKASGTCDRWLCDRCAASVGPDKDYCPPHQRLSQEAAKTP
jgi:hypothetical protein